MDQKKKVRRYVEELTVSNYIVGDVIDGLSKRFELDLTPITNQETNQDRFNETTKIKVYEVLGN